MKQYYKVVYLWDSGSENFGFVGEAVLQHSLQTEGSLTEQIAIKKITRLNSDIYKAVILTWEEISVEGYRYLLNHIRHSNRNGYK